MSVLKKSKYFIGGIESDKLESIVKGLIYDASIEDKTDELREICKEVLRITEIRPTVVIPGSTPATLKK